MISIQRNFWLAAVAISGGSHGGLYGRHLCAIYLVLREVLSKSNGFHKTMLWLCQDINFDAGRICQQRLGGWLPRLLMVEVCTKCSCLMTCRWASLQVVDLF
jgi:hypothetical protein